MLVSAVLDPFAFDAGYFDALYAIHAEDFLKGIRSNGLLIVDSDNRLRDALVSRIESIPIKYGQRLQILLAELLLKRKSKRVATCHVSPHYASSTDLLDLTYHLKTVSEADALIVRNQGLEVPNTSQQSGPDIVPLSEYRDSNFEKDRQRYEKQVGPIDTLPKSEVQEIIIRSIRFAKWLRFYDPYIGKGKNTSAFRKGIEYILSLWYEHGFFASDQSAGSVEIFTCIAERIRDDETDHAKASKLVVVQC